MKSKKADLMNNVLTTIIAVVGLAIIFFAAWKLYSVYINQEEKNAQRVINTLEAKFNALEDGQIGKANVKMVLNWRIFGWSRGDSVKPDKCYFSSCVCICKMFADTDDSVKVCQEKGYCRLLDKEKVSVISLTSYLKQKKEDQLIKSEDDVINFLKNPALLEDPSRNLELGTDYSKHIRFLWKENMAEINVYRNKTHVVFLQANYVDAPRG